ncbi:ABC transporter substrate-binding protein [Candidatus Bipolaricaulota bacterium]|nr:ABC transporter substrate-binding protein [Candidatus Bipolaricaulota bacterium]
MRLRRLLVGIFLVSTVATLGLGGPKLIIAGRDGVYGAAMQLAVDLYKAEHPDVDIELLKLPYSGLYEKLVIDFREAIGAYDVVLLDDVWATEFMSLGWLANLEALGFTAEADFVGKALAVGRYPYAQGALYAVPHVGNVELFAYRKDLFDKYGLPEPKSWLEVLGAAALIERYEPGIKGIVFRGKKGNPIVTGFLPIFWSFGAEILDVDGRPTLNSPQAVAALKFFLAMKAFAPTGVEIYDSSELRDALQGGTVAIATEVWPAWVPALDDPAKSKVVGQVEIIPHPGLVAESSPVIGIWLLAIPTASKNKATALDFLRFVSSPAVQKKLALEVGLPPTRVSVYQDPEVVAKYRWYPAQLAALDASRPRPRVPEWAQIEGVLGDYLQLALVGSMPPEEALAAAQARVEEILR